MCYDVYDCVETSVFLTDDEEDDKKSVNYGDEDVGPDEEEREALRVRYLEYLNENIDILGSRVSRLKELANILDKNNFSLATFDAVENALSEIICQV